MDTSPEIAQPFALGLDRSAWGMCWAPDFMASSMLVDFGEIRNCLEVDPMEPFYVLSDLDSTLREVHSQEIEPCVAAYLRQQIESGVIALAITTNSSDKNIEIFGSQIHSSVKTITPSTLGLKKQHKGYYYAAMDWLGISGQRALVAGDKSRRDILGAHKAGLPSLLVKPLGETELWFDRCGLRRLDRLALGIGSQAVRWQRRALRY